MTDQGTERSALTPEEVLGLTLAQIRALYATNATLFAAMHGMVDMEQVRSRALESFTDDAKDVAAAAHVNAMLRRPSLPETPLVSDEPQKDPRTWFSVIEGGRQP